MTTPEPVSPAPSDDRDPFEVAYDADQDGRDLTGPERAALNDALTPAVSPAPDTEALRQQVAESIARDKERITSWNELSEWGQELYSQKAHELLSSSYVAGLRADLDQARAERDKFADEVDRLNLEIQRHQVGDGYQRGHEHGVQAGLQHAARSASAIPDGAAAQIAQCLSDYWISLRGRRQDADETEHGQAEDVDRLVRSWLAPTTGPAPAAADATAPYRELLGAIWLYVKWHYVTKQLTTEQKELWADAVDAFAEPQEGKAERWWREPAAPQAPAEPKKQCAWWWDTKQCPDWAAPGGKYCNGHQRDHNDLLRVVPEAAREDTAPPAWTGHTVEVTSNKDDLHDVACTSGCGWLGVCISEQGANDLADRHRADTLRPSAPTEEV